jgi:hypothetical protein
MRRQLRDRWRGDHRVSAHSKLPQQIDVRAEAGVQIEVDHLRGVAYMHVDGYTCARVNYRGIPISVEIKHDTQRLRHSAGGTPLLAPPASEMTVTIEEMVNIEKAAKAIAGMIITERFLHGKILVLNLTGPEVDALEKDIVDLLRGL